MTENKKRELYESIMGRMSTVVRDVLINEGAWGYQPIQSDSCLDMRDPIIIEFLKSLEKKVKKAESTDKAFDCVGVIDYFLSLFDSRNELMVFDKECQPLIDLMDKHLEICENDEKWIEDWKEPKKTRESLEALREKVEYYRRRTEE